MSVHVHTCLHLSCVFGVGGGAPLGDSFPLGGSWHPGQAEPAGPFFTRPLLLPLPVSANVLWP